MEEGKKVRKTKEKRKRKYKKEEEEENEGNGRLNEGVSVRSDTLAVPL